MLNRFCRKPLHQVTRTLARVAMGTEKAEMVIRNARLVNVCTAEIQEGIDVAIAEGRIALVGNAAHCIGPATRVIDASGLTIAPGFIDAHLHVESSMITVAEYARAVIPRGTTAIFMDPHEICNVCGMDGVRYMIEDAARTPLKAISNAPSCVPGVPGFESPGASIGPEDIREMMTWEGIMGLGEMMDYPGVLSGDVMKHAELAQTLMADQVITGHYPETDTGAGLNAYIASGVRCCHESSRAEDVLEKMRRGMYALIRYGSAWHDLPVILRAILDNRIDDRFACLVTDDRTPDALVREGHMDHLLRLAVAQGLDPVRAIQYVTLNAAACYRMDHEIGSITPGKCADIVFLSDLQELRVVRTIIDGVVVAEDGRITVDFGEPHPPEFVFNTLHVGHPITADSFAVPAPEGRETVRVRAFEIIPDHIANHAITARMNVLGGRVEADPSQDLLKIAVFERHHETGTQSCGFVKGFGFTRGALAQTVAHDAHNLLVTGCSDADMALAANTLIDCGGGICAAAGGRVLALVPLPIAGLMSPLSAAQVGEQLIHLGDALKDMGCTLHNSFMTLSMLSLPCIPDLRLTNFGLVDCKAFRFTGLFVE